MKELVGHLLWFGNLCWYIGIPASIIYIIWKLQSHEKDFDAYKARTATYLNNTWNNIDDEMTRIDKVIKSNDKYLVGQVNELRTLINK